MHANIFWLCIFYKYFESAKLYFILRVTTLTEEYK